MRYTKKLSMWPVGLSGGRTYETPILKDGKVGAFKESNQILHKNFSVFRFYIYIADNKRFGFGLTDWSTAF